MQKIDLLDHGYARLVDSMGGDALRDLAKTVAPIALTAWAES